jgi:hypothetical protein
MQSEDEYRLDHDIISQAIEDILNILSANEPGLANPEAQEKIFALAEMIRDATTDSYIEEKTIEIESRADEIYSATKHQKYSGGARELSDWMLSSCDQIRIRANFAKSIGKATST